MVNDDHFGGGLAISVTRGTSVDLDFCSFTRKAACIMTIIKHTPEWHRKVFSVRCGSMGQDVMQRCHANGNLMAQTLNVEFDI